ncbi:MAG: amylo-alpha-1,6-glucosidase [Lentimicrobiaceae bacterium]|nr:amylo-alpha-1,6-glucosidase [Lentimicrobiaceae bacterium]
MAYIQFDKLQLINLEYSLSKELLRSSRTGSYASSTIVNCNTRKYHGMLVTPQPAIDNDNHVLLSSFDETVIQHDAEFNLGIHKYPGDNYFPKGHKYIRDFTAEPIPKQTYRVGGVVLDKEILFTHKYDLLIIKYTLREAHSPTKLRFKPFLAFRNVHKLSKANIFVDNKYEIIQKGIKIKMYQDYTPIFMQFSKQTEYTHVPDWYYNIEYIREAERGYECHEDLYVPGFFEMEIKKGESLYFSAGIEEINPANLKRLYNTEINIRIPRNSFENCLLNSAQQFIVFKDKKVEIVAGYPWFGRWGRDTFISLPGLTLVNNDFATCKAAIDTMLHDLKGPLFPNIGSGDNSAYNSVDAPLWFFWALQLYAEFTSSQNTIWKTYGNKMKLILSGFREGTSFNIKMQKNGLIYAGEAGRALTWMDAVINGKPVTPRIGMPVEINALWYNAIMFSLEMAQLANDKQFISEWSPIADIIPIAFENTFWDEKRGYLADYVDKDYKNWSMRPNQIFVTSLKYSPVNEEIRKIVVSVVKKELLTPRGLRTLSPQDKQYKGIYKGDQATRDAAYHQGTAWPWLLGHFAEGYLKIHGKSGLSYIKNIYKQFAPDITERGIGTISEVYDGDPPHLPGGAISQAWSVAELLRINWLINEYEKNKIKL